MDNSLTQIAEKSDSHVENLARLRNPGRRRINSGRIAGSPQNWRHSDPKFRTIVYIWPGRRYIERTDPMTSKVWRHNIYGRVNFVSMDILISLVNEGMVYLTMIPLGLFWLTFDYPKMWINTSSTINLKCDKTLSTSPNLADGLIMTYSFHIRKKWLPVCNNGTIMVWRWITADRKLPILILKRLSTTADKIFSMYPHTNSSV